MTREALRRAGVNAVFGGTFDPPHWGHVRTAEAVRDRMGVGTVWLVPAAVPPHREVPPRLTPGQRLRLVRAAAEGRERLEANGIELKREGPSYTVDTLDRLARECPFPPRREAPVLFVAGSDAFAEIRTWSRFEELLERHPVLVHRRAGCPLASALAALPVRFRSRVTADPGAPLIPPRIVTMDIPLPDIASRRIRAHIRDSRPVSDLVPPAVAALIRREGHYR